MKERTYKTRVGQDKQLRAKKKESAYKNTNTYLNSVWRLNKGYLEDRIEKFNDPRSKREIWKEKVKEYTKFINPETGKRYTVKQAIDQVQRSELITSENRRLSEVSFSRIRELAPKSWHDIRQAIGWKTSFNPENVVESWTKDKINYFRYKDKATGRDILVVEERSPKSGEVKVEVFDYNDWLESSLKNSRDAKDIALYNIIKAENKNRADEINRIRKITQGENYIRYKED